MLTRTRLARTRLALAGLAVTGVASGLAAVSGSADAAHAAHPAHTTRSAHASPAGHAAAVQRGGAPTVTIEVKKKAPVVSARVTPGVTTFDVRRDGSGGGIDILSLRRGYTMADLRKDAGGLFQGDVKAVRRIDHKVVFLGGVPTPKAKGDSAAFSVRLPRGTYHLVNLDKGTASLLRVRGHRHTGALPHTASRLDFVGEMRFSHTDVVRDGWVSVTNRTDEPHFISLAKVKQSTTHQQVKKFLASGADGQPAFALTESHDTLPLSPGHTMAWRVRASHGKYVALCFWPSDENGKPHALMGMWRLLHVR